MKSKIFRECKDLEFDMRYVVAKDYMVSRLIDMRI